MKIAKIIHHHRFGEDCLMVRVPEDWGDSNLPKITNDLLRQLGAEPELERDDEWADWDGICDVKDLPSLP